MKTFLSWIVANIEIVLAVITTILSILILVFGLDSNYTEEQFINIFVAGVIMFVFYCIIAAMKSFGTSLFIFLCALSIFMFGPTLELKQELGEPFSVIHNYILGSYGIGWLIFSISCLLGIMTAVFSAVNFDEVTSRRMLYRNSNVSMFESQVMYVINRFCTATNSFILSILIIKLIAASV